MRTTHLKSSIVSTFERPYSCVKEALTKPTTTASTIIGVILVWKSAIDSLEYLMTKQRSPNQKELFEALFQNLVITTGSKIRSSLWTFNCGLTEILVDGGISHMFSQFFRVL